MAGRSPKAPAKKSVKAADKRKPDAREPAPFVIAGQNEVVEHFADGPDEIGETLEDVPAGRRRYK